jgi:hypothetical protein
MWRQPAGWLDPLLGPITEHQPVPPDYFLILLRQNFEDPWEIFLGFVLLLCLALYLGRDRAIPVARAHRRGISLILGGAGLLLGAMSLASLLSGILLRLLWHRGPPPDIAIIFAIVFALPSLLALRWASELRAGTPQREPDAARGPLSRITGGGGRSGRRRHSR